MEVRNYLTPDGRAPFREWFARVRDRRARARIEQRLTRLEAGLFGDCEPVGAGVFELRIDYGPGYRIYFARHGKTIILLLTGGDKRKQDHDIERAKDYWQEFKDREG
ncbi:MAG: type II toxin-antitoxin system RelE/ParE family toxin [Gammaproteobacteria bacterium]|nr:type II toxin-antitoxin system RelE/ParE family toxin [Gammaproteobacteria bacterium]